MIVEHANATTTPATRLLIKRLHAQGWTGARIARFLGISRNTALHWAQRMRGDALTLTAAGRHQRSRHQEGRCCTCGERKTIAGRWRCDRCAKRVKAATRRRRLALTRAGRCVQCRGRLESRAHVRCFECRLAIANRQRRNRHRAKRLKVAA